MSELVGGVRVVIALPGETAALEYPAATHFRLDPDVYVMRDETTLAIVPRNNVYYVEYIDARQGEVGHE